MGSDSESICFIIPIFLLYLNSFSDYRKNIYSILLKEKEESWEIDLDRLIVSDVVLGEGEFGIVNKGSYRGQDGRIYDVAVKQLKGTIINKWKAPNLVDMFFFLHLSALLLKEWVDMLQRNLCCRRNVHNVHQYIFLAFTSLCHAFFVFSNVPSSNRAPKNSHGRLDAVIWYKKINK